MAKRPRMGRNLDALLGGSSRERTSRPAQVPSSRSESTQSPIEPSPESQQVPVESSEQTVQPESGEVPGVEASAAAAPVAPASMPIAIQTPSVESATSKSPGETHTTDLPAVLPASQSTAVAADAKPADEQTAGTTDRFRMIGVDQIRRGSYQPRRLFDQTLLQELADSIKAEGLIQPIIVRPFAGAFELVAGERRWRAAQLAGISEIPAIIRDMPDKSVAAVSLIENIQRKDLNPLEEASAFERLCDEFGMTHKAVAESVGRSRASVTNLMRLLELHDEVKVLVDKGELEMGHARAILGAPKDKQHGLAKDVLKRGLTVRAIEKLVRELVAEADGEPAKKTGSVVDPDIERLSQKLGEKLGASVRIQHKATGKGKLEINYASVAELQGILAHIK